MWLIMATIKRETSKGKFRNDLLYYKHTHNGKVIFVNQTNRRYAGLIKEETHAIAAMRHIEILNPYYKSKLKVIHAP